MSADFGTELVPGFRGRTFERPHTEFTEDMLIFRADVPPTGDLVAAFRIRAHEWDACGTQPERSDVISGLPPGPPWPERPYADLDWRENLLGVDRYLRSVAIDVGESEAVVSEGGATLEAARYDRGAGTLTAEQEVRIRWGELSDGRPGCALDVPDLPPATPCPTGTLRIRMVLTGLQ